MTSEALLSKRHEGVVSPAMNLALGLFSCIFRVYLAMLGFAQFSCRILPLPIIQSYARDTIVRLAGFLTVAHFHVRVPVVDSGLEAL
jgi:hypothetical protein